MPHDRSFTTIEESDWDAVITVHVKGTFAVTRSIFEWMKKAGRGVIVNTSSSSGMVANFGQGNYGAAKAGI
ncbi:SDR family NAD(P)-dependent oxidoreductase [Sphingobium cyanobacteriorum]|uniref:SDR family NAD(P)-dependent oxidoreductase n=1 Tax=Sphingobium cyanobacteriorum TaxID=3063954 RepID=UPI003CC6BC17